MEDHVQRDGILTGLQASISAAIDLTPCNADANTFVCGLNNTKCQQDESTFTVAAGTSFLLRPSQVSALIANSTSMDDASGKMYTSGAMTGVGLGVGLPLSFALILALLVLRQEKLRSKPKSHHRPSGEPGTQLSYKESCSSLAASRSESQATLTPTQTPYHVEGYIQPYAHHHNNNAVHGALDVPVYEMGSSSPVARSHLRTEAPGKRHW